MSLAYHERIRFMQPLWRQIWLAIRDWYVREAQRLADGIQCKR